MLEGVDRLVCLRGCIKLYAVSDPKLADFVLHLLGLDLLDIQLVLTILLFQPYSNFIIITRLQIILSSLC